MAEHKNNSGGMILSTVIGVLAAMASWIYWQGTKIPKDSKEVDTGEKTTDGKSIIEVTGVGGNDDGKKIRGYALPENVNDVQLPLSVIVRPNKNLFLNFNVGENVTFTKKDNDELAWVGTIGGAGGEYVVWYPDLIKTALGAIS